MASNNGYNESLDPVATSEEIEAFELGVKEDEEEQMLLDRFNGKIQLNEWCSCAACTLENTTKKEECFCCCDIDRCVEKINDFHDEIDCITQHTGFSTVCLDKYVLDVASIGLRTSKGRSYNALRKERKIDDSRFFRSVAYRQFFRFVWEFTGVNKRLPLPCCVYNIIRSTFPSDDGQYCGFMEEDIEEECVDTSSSSETDSEDIEELQ